MVECTTEREDVAGKITDADRARLESAAGPSQVVIVANGGARNCPLPSCSVAPCAQRESIVSRMLAENLASQRCIRDLIAAIGGTADPGSSYLVNMFVATLTWSQSLAVAAHPHVARVESDSLSER